MNSQQTEKPNRLTSLLVGSMLLLSIGITYARNNGNLPLLHLFKYSMIVVGGGLFAISLHQVRRGITEQDLILFFLLLYVLSQGLVAGGLAFTKSVVFCLMLTAWRSAEHVRISTKLTKFIIALQMLYGAQLIYTSRTPMAYMVPREGGELMITDTLTLGFSNPNETGMVLFYTISILLIATKNVLTASRWKYLVYAEVAYLYYLLIETTSRTSLLACSLTIIAILFNLENWKLRKHAGMVMALVLLHVPFCYVYMAMANMPFFAGMTFLNDKKLMSGRQHVYADFLDRWTNPTLGNLEVFQFDNAHNSGLAILVSIGLLGYIPYLIYTSTKVSELYKNLYRGKGIYPIMVLLSVFLIGYAEAAVLCRSDFFYTNLLLILCLAHNAPRVDQKASPTLLS